MALHVITDKIAKSDEPSTFGELGDTCDEWLNLNVHIQVKKILFFFMRDRENQEQISTFWYFSTYLVPGSNWIGIRQYLVLK